LTWIGKSAGGAEKLKGAALARALDDERAGKPTQAQFNEGDKDAAEFWGYIQGGEGPVKTAAEGGDDTATASSFVKALYSLSDATGVLKFEKVASGSVQRTQLRSDDAFVFDVGAQVFVWVGKGANTNERKAALGRAQDYLKNNNRPAYLPIIRVLEGGENEVFESFFN